MKNAKIGWGMALWISGTTALAVAGSSAMAAPIHDAAAAGDTAKIQQLLDSGAKPDDVRPGDDATALHVAVFDGKVDAVKLLIKDGASINAHTTAGYTPLHLAALKGNAEITKLLLDAGAAVDAISAGGETPLHMAAMAGNTDVVSELLDAGADRGLRDFEGRTAYDIAKARGNETLAKLVTPGVSQTPSIYRDGTAEIEKRIQQTEAVIARNRENLAKDTEQDALAKPDLNGSITPSTPNSSKELSTEDLLKAAGNLIDSTTTPTTLAPTGIDAVVAGEVAKDNPAPPADQAPGSSSLDPSLDNVLADANALVRSSRATGNNTAPSTGDYAVQLASLKSPEDARQEWTRLTTAHPDLLVALDSSVVSADLGDRGTFYRLRAGPLTKDRASSICDSLAENHEDCMVVRQ